MTFHAYLGAFAEIFVAFRVELFLFFLGAIVYQLFGAVTLKTKKVGERKARPAPDTGKARSVQVSRSVSALKHRAQLEALAAKGLHADAIAIYDTNCKTFHTSLVDCSAQRFLISHSADLSLVTAALHCGRDDIITTVLQATFADSHRLVFMIRSLARSGNLGQALHVFELLAGIDATKIPVLVYNATLDACVENGTLKSAVDFMQRMKSAGIVDTITYNTIIKAHLRRDCFGQVRKLMDEMVQLGFTPNVVTYNACINAIAQRSKNYEHSQVWELVEEMRRHKVPPTAFTFSVLLKNLKPTSPHNDFVRIMDLVGAMDDVFDEVLLSSVIEACVRGKKTSFLSQWFGSLGDNYGGVEITGSHAYGSLLKGYGHTGNVDTVWCIWKEMHSRHIRPTSITIGCMVEAVASNGDVDGAYELVVGLLEDDEAKDHINAIIFGSILKGYGRARRMERVWAVFQEMQASGIKPTAVTYNVVIDACARNNQSDAMIGLVEEMQARGLETNLITYNTMIKGFCHARSMPSAFLVVDNMRKTTKFKPDEVLYSTLLDGCCQSRFPNESEQIFADMQAEGFAPTNYDLTCLVKVMGQARRLDRAFEIVEIGRNCNVKLNYHVFSALLHACVSCHDLDRAVRVYHWALGEGVQPQAHAGQPFVRALLRGGKHKQAVELVQKVLTTEAGPDAGKRRATPSAALEDAFLLEVMGALTSNSSPEVVALAAPLYRDIRNVRPGLKVTEALGLLRSCGPV